MSTYLPNSKVPASTKKNLPTKGKLRPVEANIFMAPNEEDSDEFDSFGGKQGKRYGRLKPLN